MSFMSETNGQVRVLYALLAVAVGMATVIVTDYLRRDMRVPVEAWHRVEALNSPVRAGEALQTRIWRTKVRDDCPVASSRQAVSDDGMVFDLEDEVGRGGPASDEYLDFDYQIPSAVPPGDYTLRVYLTYTCPEFVWTTQQPDVRFRAVE